MRYESSTYKRNIRFALKSGRQDRRRGLNTYLYEDTVKECISGTLINLTHLQKVALWMQSDAAIDWLSEHEDGSELPGVFEPDVVEVMYSVVWQLADESKNPRVARYLARSEGDDECLF